MYICLCHGVTESAIQAAVNEGADTFRQLSFMTGCGTQCGSCASQARALFQKCLDSGNSSEDQQITPTANAA